MTTDPRALIGDHPLVAFLLDRLREDVDATVLESVELDVEVHRRLIEIHLPVRDDTYGVWTCERCSWIDGGVYPGNGQQYWQKVNAYAPCDHLQILALPYVDHPDFDPSWTSDLVKAR